MKTRKSKCATFCDKELDHLGEHSKETQHTPTPWKANVWKYVETDDGLRRIAITNYKGITSSDLDECAANAAFIVRSTNNFEKMLKAMKQVKASLDKKKYGDRKEGELEGYFALCDAIIEAEK